MLNGLDVIILLAMVGRDDAWTTRSIAAELDVPPATVHRSLTRLDRAGLYDLKRRRTNASQTEEFLVHAVKYMCPVERGGPTRGIPTGTGASVLADRLGPSDEAPPVWPHHSGRVRGFSIEPLHPSAVEIARRNQRVGEGLALIDGIRLGESRVRNLAADLLGRWLDGEYELTTAKS